MKNLGQGPTVLLRRWRSRLEHVPCVRKIKCSNTITSRDKLKSFKPSKPKICSPSPVLVTSPYECKIFEWDENPPKNKQTSKPLVFEQGGILIMCIV